MNKLLKITVGVFAFIGLCVAVTALIGFASDIFADTFATQQAPTAEARAVVKGDTEEPKPTRTQRPTRTPKPKFTKTPVPTFTPSPEPVGDCLAFSILDEVVSAQGVNPDWSTSNPDFEYYWEEDHLNESDMWIGSVGLETKGDCVIYVNTSIAWALDAEYNDAMSIMGAIPAMISDTDYWFDWVSPKMTGVCTTAQEVHEASRFFPDGTFWIFKCRTDRVNKVLLYSLSVGTQDILDE